MAGVKGRSGGQRAGAGRPRSKAPAGSQTEAKSAAGDPASTRAAPPAGQAEPAEHDSLSYLRSVINDPKMDALVKVRAAITLAQYEHQKIADGGIKPARRKAATEAGAGKFAPSAPPLRLVKKA